jgi:amino acid transporter
MPPRVGVAAVEVEVAVDMAAAVVVVTVVAAVVAWWRVRRWAWWRFRRRRLPWRWVWDWWLPGWCN